MNSLCPTPSSARGHAAHNAATRSGVPYMSERQTQAYLQARDAVRRVQRISALVGAISRRAADNFDWTQDDRQRSH